MLGSVAKKVTWLARATTTVVGLAIMLALVLGVASTALARTGVGATLDLGKTNTVDAVSKLVGSVAGPSLKVDNTTPPRPRRRPSTCRWSRAGRL
jgi:hypothetical protein